MDTRNLKHILNGMIILGVALVVVLMNGCAAPARTAQEVQRNHIHVIQTNWIMIQDDIDAALLLDRPTRLSEMVVR
jgi:hypothetical protein